VDIDAFIAAHRPAWDRLDHLVKNRSSLTGAEVDELVDLYQRVATHLSILRSSSSDPRLVGRLSALVARARSAVTGAHTPAWRELARFVTVSFPVVAYRARWWWLATVVASVAVAWVLGAWVAGSPEVQASIASDEEITQLVEHEFADYYSENPAASFASRVWINNAWVSAQMIMYAAFLGLPIPYVLYANAANVGISGGLMASRDKLDIFFGLITPHGLLELTAVFLAAAAGRRAGRAGPGRDERGAGAGRGAVRVGADRGVRDSVGAADMGADQHRSDRRGGLPGVRDHLRSPRPARERDRRHRTCPRRRPNRLMPH
jgi:uncharacterized membrane protein SpoIIM required for sporulation